MNIVVNRKYNLIEKIGGGAFGSVYKGQNIRTNEFVAIKVEPIEGGVNLLKNESIIYQYLQNCSGVPTVKWFGKDDTNYYMVIKLLGKSLQTIHIQKKTFSLKLVLQLGVKIIKLLKTIHDKGLVHRDIKPDNFLLGLDTDKNNIYIIDFGFCKTYMRNNQHIPLTKTNSLIGSLTYASTNAHDFKELSRRDDLESLGYMLMFFYLGHLPWQNIVESNDIHIRIKEVKQKIIEYCALPSIINDYMNYVTQLDFYEEPLYHLIINNFEKEIEIL
jgi:serine/threonine protein kinase